MKKRVSILIGPLLFLLCYFGFPESVLGSSAANAAVGTLAWMAYWWIGGAVDYAVTAFLPIAINAVFQIADMSSVISQYASETIMLLLGASILTVSWEETGLDKRIAASFLSLIGSNLRRQIVFWFILCFLLSSILPNSVVCAAMTPIAVSMLHYIGVEDVSKNKMASLLLLTIAYAAGAGGVATPLGGAMNLVSVGYIEQITGAEFIYTSWVIRFLPIVIMIVVSNIVMLLIGVKKDEELGGSREYFIQQYKSMPPMSQGEKASLILFVVATVLSFTRQLYQTYLPGLKPAYIFIICAIIAFCLTHSDGTRLMEWGKTQKRIVWGLMYVFAGGLALGVLLQGSGVTDKIGQMVANADLNNSLIFILVIVVFTILLSDVTSATATAAVALPIVISVVQGMGQNPIPYVYIASAGLNISYMFPTSIRAIPVGYGLEPKYMLKKGVPITIVLVALLTGLGYVLLKYWPLFSTV